MLTVAAVTVLAHQGGWDETLMVLTPIAVFALLLKLANGRASRAQAAAHLTATQLTATEATAAEADVGSPPGADPESPSDGASTPPDRGPVNPA